MKPYRSVPGIAQSILNVLHEDRWLTTAMIAAQIAIPPDAIERGRFRQRSYTRSPAGSGSNIVAGSINSLVKRGLVESRPVTRCKLEYRLAKKTQSNSTN